MKKQLLLAAALTVATTACTTHQIQYKNPSIAATGETHSAKQSFFLWGLAGGSEIDLSHVCPNGVASIDSKTSAIDNILTAVTGGLYSPMSVEVKCGGNPVASRGAE
jgi:hypothetical protein